MMERPRTARNPQSARYHHLAMPMNSPYLRPYQEMTSPFAIALINLYNVTQVADPLQMLLILPVTYL